MNLSFSKIATVGSTGLTPGRIYFETTTGCIKVAKSETEVDIFGAGVKSAELVEDGKKLQIVNQDGKVLTVDFSDVASASAVAAELAKKLGIGTEADQSSVQSYYGLKKYTDEAKEGAISSANSYTDSKIAEIPAAIKYKGDGTTITEAPGEGEVTFSVGTIEQAKVNGLTDALGAKADKVHTHEIDDVTGLQDALDGKANSVHTHVSADITDLQDKLDAKADKSHSHVIADLTDLNDGWDALLTAAPDVAKDSELTALEGRVDTAESKLSGIEAGAQVNKIESIKVNGSPLSISDKAVEIPNAASETYGVITENRVKALAGEVAGSVYKVKGTKATIDEVLAVGTAAVGDVYNVTAEFTLNGQKYPAGTNVVFVGPGEEGEPDPTQQVQWDALGGTVDLTPYAKTSEVAATYATKETVTALDGRVSTVEGQVATKAEQSEVTELSGKVDTNTAAIAQKADKSALEALTARVGTAESDITTIKSDYLQKTEATSTYAAKSHTHVKADITDFPTNVSEFTNDAGYLTEIPAEYVTDTELEGKGYITKTAADAAYDAKGSADNALTQAKAYADGLLVWAEF